MEEVDSSIAEGIILKVVHGGVVDGAGDVLRYYTVLLFYSIIDISSYFIYIILFYLYYTIFLLSIIIACYLYVFKILYFSYICRRASVVISKRPVEAEQKAGYIL